jgi:hypothetical protein
MPTASHILNVASLEGLSPLPTVTAYGDQDDHLRLTVLLASQLEPGLDAKNVNQCRDPRTPWEGRKRALKHLLQEAQSRDTGLFVRLVDPDALDIGELSPERRWDDATFLHERAEFFSLLLESVSEGGWQLVRQEPREWTTNKLEQLGCEQEEGPVLASPAASGDARRLEEALQPASLALRPLLLALVNARRAHPREAARMLEAASASQLDDVIFEMAYDALDTDAVETAKRLALLRGPQPWNGVAGPFALRDDFLSPLELPRGELPRAAVEELVETRWLDVHTDAQGRQRFSMANTIRRFLLERAAITHGEQRRAEHHWLASREPADVNESVEVHHHAVESMDRSLAERTAWYYGADLRRIAFDLSANQKDYRQAAEVYRLIVQRFDAEDAYAWEYLAYNLALSYKGQEIPDAARDEIRSAYARASKLDSDNPLYKGRELGFRARTGERVHTIHTEFRRFLHRFRQMGNVAVSYYSKPVLEVMSHQERWELARRSQAEGLLTSLPELKGFF